ncbi:VOC family protein [soil metagenome]
MTKEIWLNLPVKDVQQSRAFFVSLGFKFNEQRSMGDDAACMLIGEKNVVIMLFKESIFESFTQKKSANLNEGSEILISIDAANREEVDELAAKAAAAGGIVFGKPGENQGWMYGCGFSDLDGHRWNVLHMDLSKMPK